MDTKESDMSRQKGVLGKNTLINILGQGIPLLFALLALPFVIDGLGTERFGVLMTIWVVTGYFSLFDMGLGRATTKFIADEDASGGEDSYSIIFTSITLLTFVGLLGALVVITVTPLLTDSVLNIPSELVDEAKGAFYILSFSIPFVLGSLGARGVLEARQQFGIVNAIKIPASLINYVGPVPVLFFTNSLIPIVTLLVAARVVTYFVYLYFCSKEERFQISSRDSIKKWSKKLFGFGAWLTVSNIVSPLMSYMDRFIVGAILTMTAVTYYTTPYEVVSRLLIISGSFMAVMFPAFSVYAAKSKFQLTDLFQASVRYLILVLAPVALFILFSSEALLHVWLGSEFSENSTTAMQILVIGMFINSLAMVPFTALQAYGRPDLIAKIHLIELPVYLVMIWYFTHQFGIAGVAFAWTVRVAIDGLLILYVFNKYVKVVKFTAGWVSSLLFVLLSITVLYTFALQNTEGFVMLLFLSAVFSILLFFFLWIKMMNRKEKNRIKRLVLSLKWNFLKN